jgi:ParB-like nuclease domain
MPRAKVPVNGDSGPTKAIPEGPERINPNLKGWIIPIESLKPDPKNPRKHPPKNLAAIQNSLSEFGQQTPIVITNKRVVQKGNGTLEAALALGWKRIAAVPTDLASQKLQTAYKIADNKTGLLGDWDFEILAEEFKAFQDVDWSGLGWEDWELAPILQADWTPARIEDGDGGPGMTNIKVTAEQKAIIDQAIAKCREHGDDAEMTEGRALELICGDYLAS